MHNPLANQKQLTLLRHTFQALKKMEQELQLQRYQFPDQEARESSEPVPRDVSGITDTQALERAVLAYVALLEKRFIPEKQRIQMGQISLLKRAMLTLKYMQTMLEQRKSQAILPLVSRNQPFPLSFAQQRLWFLHQLEPDSSAYTVAGAVRLQGQLHIAALEQSLNEIIRRHEVLRTAFVEYEKQTVQMIVPSAPIALPCIDLRNCSASELTDAVREQFSAEAERPFDLQQVPLLRGRLLQLREQEYTLLLTVHHLAFDGWSSGIFFRELATLYAAYAQNAPSPLPELLIQYADYARWQLRWLQGEVLEQLVDYWRTALAGAPGLLRFPTDRPRSSSSSSSSAGGICTFRLGDLHVGIRKLAQREGVTLFMVLLAAFQVLLYRWSGQEDFVVGTDIANRTRPETEGLIGFFVNLLALRTRISGSQSFQRYLQQVREQVLAAYVHQALPFEKLIETLHVQRTENQVPLVQVLFVLQDTLDERLELPGLTLEVSAVPIARAKFDLAVFIEEQAQGLVGTITYRTALFEESTIQRLGGWFVTLLTEIIEQPQTSLDALQFYTQSEQEKISSKEKEFHHKKSEKIKMTKRRSIQVAK